MCFILSWLGKTVGVGSQISGNVSKLMKAL